MRHKTWTVRLSAAAEADYRQIVRWTADHFGRAQAQVYAGTLSAALQMLGVGPEIPGVKDRPDIGVNIRTLHVARNGRKGRHIIVFRVRNARGCQLLEVLRLLHDSMDLERHLPPDGLD